MHRGYVKLWRKSLESGLLQNAEAWQLMTWCLLKATHKPHKQLVGSSIVELQPGQLIFGRKKAAEEGICVWCKQKITDFRDSLSIREYMQSGLCQECQDKTFGT